MVIPNKNEDSFSGEKLPRKGIKLEPLKNEIKEKLDFN